MVSDSIDLLFKMMIDRPNSAPSLTNPVQQICNTVFTRIPYSMQGYFLKSHAPLNLGTVTGKKRGQNRFAINHIKMKLANIESKK